MSPGFSLQSGSLGRTVWAVLPAWGLALVMGACSGAAGTGGSGGSGGGAGGGSCSPSGVDVGFAGLTSVDNLTSTSARLNWTDHAQAKAYTIYDVSAGTPALLATLSAPASQYTVSGLTAGSSYTFRVRLLNGEGVPDTNVSDVAIVTPVMPSPPDYPGLVLWLRADVGVVKDGSDVVSDWLDQSSSGADSSQASAGMRPTWIASAISGWPALRFDGTDDHLGAPSVLSGNSARTVFVVMNRLSAPNTYNVPLDLSQTVTGTGTNFAVTSELAVRVSGNRVFNQGLSDGIPGLLNVRMAQGANITSVEGWVNGISASEASSSGTVLNTQNSGVFIGRAGFTASGGGHCHCDISEVIVYNTSLSEPDRQDVETYLMSKYGL